MVNLASHLRGTTMIRMVLHQHLLVCQVNLLLGSVWPAYENPFPKLLQAKNLVCFLTRHTRAISEDIVVVPALLLLLLLLLLLVLIGVLEKVLKVLIEVVVVGISIRLATVLTALMHVRVSIGVVVHFHVSPSDTRNVAPYHASSISSRVFCATYHSLQSILPRILSAGLLTILRVRIRTSS